MTSLAAASVSPCSEALGEHIFLLGLEERELADFRQIAVEARSPPSAGIVAGRVLSLPLRIHPCDVPRSALRDLIRLITYSESSLNSSCMSAGMSLSNDKASLVTGWMNPSSRRVQRLAAETQPFEQRSRGLSCSSIDRIADQRMADRRHVDAHLMRAPGFQPAFDQRRAVAAADHPPVRHRALAARRSTIAIFLRLVARPRERRSTVPAGGGQAGDDREIARDRCCARRTGPRAPRARGRSWRRPSAPTCPCRCGGRCLAARRRRCPTACRRQWWSSALTSVPSRLPAAGWTTSPAGLSITIRCSSSKTMTSGMSCASLCAGVGVGHGDREDRAGVAPAPRGRGRRLVGHRHAPAAISAFSRSRDSVGTAAASARSSRQPAASAGSSLDDRHPRVHR